MSLVFAANKRKMKKVIDNEGDILIYTITVLQVSSTYPIFFDAPRSVQLLPAIYIL